MIYPILYFFGILLCFGMSGAQAAGELSYYIPADQFYTTLPPEIKEDDAVRALWRRNKSILQADSHQDWQDPFPSGQARVTNRQATPLEERIIWDGLVIEALTQEGAAKIFQKKSDKSRQLTHKTHFELAGLIACHTQEIAKSINEERELTEQDHRQALQFLKRGAYKQHLDALKQAWSKEFPDSSSLKAVNMETVIKEYLSSSIQPILKDPTGLLAQYLAKRAFQEMGEEGYQEALQAAASRYLRGKETESMAHLVATTFPKRAGEGYASIIFCLQGVPEQERASLAKLVAQTFPGMDGGEYSYIIFHLNKTPEKERKGVLTAYKETPSFIQDDIYFIIDIIMILSQIDDQESRLEAIRTINAQGHSCGKTYVEALERLVPKCQ